MNYQNNNHRIYLPFFRTTGPSKQAIAANLPAARKPLLSALSYMNPALARRKLWPLLCSILFALPLWPANQLITGTQHSKYHRTYMLAAQILPNHSNLDLRPSQPLPYSSNPETLENQIKIWINALQDLMQSQTGYPQTSLGEASSQEAELFRAIEQLASYYGFISRSYSLAQIKTMHSFSRNIEVLLPRSTENSKIQEMILQRQFPNEIWPQIRQSQREVLLLTAISGASSQDILTLLTFIALAAKTELPLPVRIVFLGSELPPSQLSDFAKDSALDLRVQYPLGSRSFLYYYQLPKPYALVYLYHPDQKQQPTHPQFPVQALYQAGQNIAEQLHFWVHNILNPTNNVGNWISNIPILGQEANFFHLQVIYDTGYGQTALPKNQQLVQALQKQKLNYHFNNTERFLRILQDSENPSASSFSPMQTFGPYLEKQWPIIALYQGGPDYAGHYEQLAQALFQFVEIQLEQAIGEQYLENSQSHIQDKLGQPASLSKSSNSFKQQAGKHYWLWNISLSAQLPSFLSQGYISERQILRGVLLAVLLFALSSLLTHSHIRQLHTLHRIKFCSICKYVLCIIIFAISYTLLANESTLFILQNWPYLQASSNIKAGFSVLNLGVIALIKICFTLLFLCCSALVLNLRYHLEAQVVPYLSQCIAFVTLLFLLWQDFSLGLLGLYLFFLYSLYFLLLFPQFRPRRLLLRLLYSIVQDSIICLLFLPYFFIIFILPAPVANIFTLLTSRNLKNHLWTLLLFVPALLLYFAQMQLYRLHHPSRYRRFLLRHIILYILLIALGTGVFTFQQGDPSAGSPQQPQIVAHANSEQLHLQELFVVSQDSNSSPMTQDDFSRTGRTQKQPNLSEQRSSGYKISLLNKTAKTWQSLRANSEANIQLRPASMITEQQNENSKDFPELHKNHFNLKQHRPFEALEEKALQQLSQRLLLSNSRQIRKNYSSILSLNSAVRLNYIHVQVRAPLLEPLYASNPFSISRPIPGQESSLQNSQLLLGFFPPPRLQMELVLGQAPQQYQLRYDLELQIPSAEMQEQLQRQGDPLALFLFPLLSQLYIQNSTGHDRQLQVGRDFNYVVVIRSLEKLLN